MLSIVGSLRHVTPRYAYDRVRWKVHHWRRPFDPYLNAMVAGALADLVRPHHRGLETGAGASTVWFAEKCRHLTSVEHDPAWARRVASWLAQRGLTDRVDLRLCARTSEGTPGSYIQVIEEQPAASLDFVLIDGKKRDQCAVAALPKLRPGGLMIVDDVHRYIPRQAPSRAPFARGLHSGFASATWRTFADLTSDWPCIWRSDGVSDTALWIKPCS